MGCVISSIRSHFFQVPIHAVMIGYDGAGKTTILHALRLGKCRITIPAIGLTIESATYKNFTLKAWDVGGSSRIHHLWRHIYKDAVGVIFVVDSSDADLITDAKDVLWRVLSELDRLGLETIPLLVYANKQDLASAMLVAEVRDALDLRAITGREWHIQGTSALKEEGLKEGFDWFVTQLNMPGLPSVSS
ncbi:MAG: ADP-ribosylation factor [Benniella sp.]|nr:MAG: ADP-ribosylation factor [Benniella sp.]